MKHFTKYPLMTITVAILAQACDGVNMTPTEKRELALAEALEDSGLDIEDIARIQVLANGSLSLNDNRVSISDLAAAIEKLPANQLANSPIIIADLDVSQAVLNKVRDIIHASAFPKPNRILTSIEDPRED
ncbi:MAG: hypothetical protein AAF583_15790 [Pseudomonadota bacterium]